ncbi:hypothetical protein M422DRAFT_243524 [Sphaerobolus stellatus SS14]|nr:hypothetical protein M422DRAFT_243524 [Sphaerobolus stellatus SS14]
MPTRCVSYILILTPARNKMKPPPYPELHFAASIPSSPQSTLPCCFNAVLSSRESAAFSMDRCRLSEIATSPDAWKAQPIAHEQSNNSFTWFRIPYTTKYIAYLGPLADTITPLDTSGSGGSSNPVDAIGGIISDSGPVSSLGGITGGGLDPVGELGVLTGSNPVDSLGGLAGGDSLNGLPMVV